MDDNVILRALMGAAGASVLAEIDLEKKRQEAEDLRKDRDHWKQARQEAHEAGELMKAEIETLRQELADAQRAVSDAFAEVNSLREQLDAAQAAVTLQRAGIERLAVFVWKVREAVKLRSDAGFVPALERVIEVLAELDETPEPTPVAEPAPCPECERLRAFVEIMRGLLTAEYADQRIIAAAIAKLDDAGNSSVTLTSSPTPVAETLDAEGGA